MKIKITKNSKWVKEFLKKTQPFEEKIVNGTCFGRMATGKLPIKTYRQVLISFFPLVETFPKYMGLLLSKIPPDNTKRNNLARYWLTQNINIERHHADWYRDWCLGIGVPARTINKEVYPAPEIDAINNYLWRVCTYGSLAEALAALNYAIEGPTGKWTEKVYKDMGKKYNEKDGVKWTGKSRMWLRAHAHYDDIHPEEVLELIKLFATTKEEQKKVLRATQTSMTYYSMAAEACCTLYE